MTTLFLALSIFATTLQSVFKKKVNAKCTNCEFTVSTAITFFALLYFLIFSDKSFFDTALIPYSLAFSLCYATAAVTCVLAIGCGSMALTNLALVYSKIIPIFYSIFFRDETLSSFRIVGLICLALSLFLTYFKRDGEGVSLKWMFYVFLLFLSNGMCSVLMREQQVKFDGKSDGTFMVISLVIVVMILGISALIRERGRVVETLKKGIGWCALCGAGNGTANYFAFICLTRIPGIVYYPISSAGDLVLTFIFSVALFRERFTRNQIIGFVFGILSIILINL